MRLTENPTVQQLRALIAACDDQAADHVLWVDHVGTVYIVPMQSGMTPAMYSTHLKDELRFRFETFQRGNDYVGIDASNDTEHVETLFHHLLDSWQKGNTGYVDS